MNLAENNRRKMKLLILCALVAVAAAGYQPSDVLEQSDGIDQQTFLSRVKRSHHCGSKKCLNGGRLKQNCACECVNRCLNRGKRQPNCGCKCRNKCWNGGKRQPNCGCDCVNQCLNNGLLDRRNCRCRCTHNYGGSLCQTCILTQEKCQNDGIFNAGICECICDNGDGYNNVFRKDCSLLTNCIVDSAISRGSGMRSFRDIHVQPLGNTGGYIVNRLTSSKFLLFRTPNNTDPCKLQVRCVTSQEYYGRKYTDKDMVWLDWCGFAFWSHYKKKKRYYRNWVVGQSYDQIIERGRPYLSGPTCVKVIEPHTFPNTKDSAALRALGQKGFLMPEEHCNTKGPVYTIQSEGTGTDRNIIFESNCCKWFIKWSPRGRRSKIEIRLKKGNSYKDKDVEGLCGRLKKFKCTKCKPKETAPCWDAADQVFTSCIDFTHNKKGTTHAHDWQNHRSGSRMTGTCSTVIRPKETIPGCEEDPNDNVDCTELT